VGDRIRHMPEALAIVPVEQIPKETSPCPVDDLQVLFKTCLQMENVCLTDDGVGLSAAQVGIPWKLFVVRYRGGSVRTGLPPKPARIYFRYFLDCKYESLGDEKDKSLEGCLSLRHPDGRFRHFEVERYKRVRVVGKEFLTRVMVGDIATMKVIDVTLEPDDVYRIVFQHEIDHQNNILISDIGKEINIWK
jgi:peptide deformylase